MVKKIFTVGFVLYWSLFSFIPKISANRQNSIIPSSRITFSKEQSPSIKTAWEQLKIGEYESAVKSADSIILSNRDSPFWQNWAQLIKAESYFELGNLNEALFLTNEAFNEITNENVFILDEGTGSKKNFPTDLSYNAIAKINLNYGALLRLKKESPENTKHFFVEAKNNYKAALESLSLNSYYDQKSLIFKENLYSLNLIRSEVYLDSESNLESKINHLKKKIEPISSKEKKELRDYWLLKTFHQVSGEYFFKQREYDNALEEFSNLIEISSQCHFTQDQLIGYYYKGQILEIEGNVDEAYSNYNHAINLLQSSKVNQTSLYNSTIGILLIDKIKSSKNDKAQDLIRTYLKTCTQLDQSSFYIYEYEQRQIIKELSEQLTKEANKCHLLLLMSLTIFIALTTVLTSFFKEKKIKSQIQKNNKLLEKQAEDLKKHKKKLEEKNDLLEKRTEELEISRGEINHRVKNNLQIVANNLRFQLKEKSTQESKTATKALREAIDRVEAIVLLHQNLYKNNTNTNITLKSYLESLLNYLLKSCNYDKDSFIYDINIDDHIKTIPDQATRLGLVITELVINAFKYSPLENRFLNVLISQNTNNQLCLKVINNKVAGTNFSQGTAPTFGLSLIEKIVEKQWKGTLTLPTNDSQFIEFNAFIPMNKLNLSS